MCVGGEKSSSSSNNNKCCSSPDNTGQKQMNGASDHHPSSTAAAAAEMASKEGVVEHYPWECISIFRQEYLSTLDLVIRDHHAMMALCLVLHMKVHGGGEVTDKAKILQYYKRLKFKMKLEYEAWSRSLHLVSLVSYGILKTLQQKMAIACYKLKELVNDPKFNSQHGLFSNDGDGDDDGLDFNNAAGQVLRDGPDEAKLIEHVRVMTY